MNCRKARKLLHRYFDGELAAALSTEVRAHLDSCAGCAAEFQALEALRKAVQSLPDMAPLPGLWARVEREVAAPRVVSVWEEAEPWFRRLVPVAAAALVLAACALVVSRSPKVEAPPIGRQLAAAVFPSYEEAILLNGPISSDMVLRATIYRGSRSVNEAR